MRLGSDVLENIPVLSREQFSLDSLFSKYTLACSTTERISRRSFCELANILSENSQMKAGLSIYLMDFLHVSRIIHAIFNRCSDLVSIQEEGAC